MATLLLIVGIVCIAAAIYLFTQKKSPKEIIIPPITEETIIEQPKLSNQEKGDIFEDYVIQYLTQTNENIRLISQVSDYNKNGVFADENMEPDLKFSHAGKFFSVECKWRNQFNDKGFISWSYPGQIERYNDYQKKTNTPVFVAIGVGGTADNPEKFFLIPLYRLTKEFATKEYIEEFLIMNKNDLQKIIQFPQTVI